MIISNIFLKCVTRERKPRTTRVRNEWKGCEPHLRYSFAVTSLQAGNDIKTVQANLGHATAASTLDVYGHVTEKMKRDSATRMQKFYESIRETNSDA